MQNVSQSSYRKGALVCALAAMLALLAASGELSAKNKNSNPSTTGQSNGIAHRVAALEAAQGESDEAITMLLAAVAELQQQIADLQVQVDDQQVQIDALDARLTAGGL
jgi:hypothetical protein